MTLLYLIKYLVLLISFCGFLKVNDVSVYTLVILWSLERVMFLEKITQINWLILTLKIELSINYFI